MRNIDKYLNNLTASPYGEGMCYRNDDAYNTKSNDICYISEYMIEEMQELSENPHVDLSDKTIRQHYGWTYKKLKQEVNDYFKDWSKEDINELLIEKDVRFCDIVDIIYGNLYWQAPSTEIEQFTYE